MDKVVFERFQKRIATTSQNGKNGSHLSQEVNMTEHTGNDRHRRQEV